MSNHNEYCECDSCMETSMLMMIGTGEIKREYDKTIGDFRYYTPSRVKMNGVMNLGENKIFGEPAWYDMGKNGIAHYVPDSFNINEEMPRTLCKKIPTIMTTHPLQSGELIDPRGKNKEGFIPMCKHCVNKLMVRK